VAHYIFNLVSADASERSRLREAAARSLRVAMWGIDEGERHRRALAPGDLVLVYLGPPAREFIGRAELATTVHDWTPPEAEVYPGDSPSGVLLSQVEEWDPAVPMATVVQRIDPSASNPYVQANAAAGFQRSVVLITGDEYEAAIALSREARTGT